LKDAENVLGDIIKALAEEKLDVDE